MKQFANILVPIDFSECSSRAMDTALELARSLGSRVTLVHVIPTPASTALWYAEGLTWPADEIDTAAKRELLGIARVARERFSSVETLTVQGDARDEIPATANKIGADLIVMGTHGRRGISQLFLGSVAAHVVRSASVPVLTVGRPKHDARNA